MSPSTPIRASIRLLAADDYDAVVEGFEALGRRTRYHRWARSTLRAETALGWMSDLDDGRSLALGACAPGSRAPMGLARYAIASAGTAELALVVVDEWQGLGLGGTLLRMLTEQAFLRGVRVVTARVLLENRRALTLMHRLGGCRVGTVSEMVELRARLTGANVFSAERIGAPRVVTLRGPGGSSSLRGVCS